MPKVIGVTGGFGTGKTFVSSVLRSLGAKVLDADSLAHSVITPGSSAHKRVVALFGENVLDGSGAINRRALGRIVFGRADALRRLNRIVHPEVIRRLKREIAVSSAKSVVVIDAPLLIEAGLAGLVDRIIVVRSSRVRQIQRCMKKFGISKSMVLKRISSQMPIKRKVAMADFVVDNDGSRSETRKQVRMIWKEIVWK